MSNPSKRNPPACVCPTSICATGFDTSFILLHRWHCGETIFAAHRLHRYQRLVIAGWRHRTVTLLYLGLALLGVALAWAGGLPGGALAAALLPPLCGLLLWWGVVRAEGAAMRAAP